MANETFSWDPWPYLICMGNWIFTSSPVRANVIWALLNTYKCKLVPYWMSKRFDYLLTIYTVLEKLFYCKVQNTWAALTFTFTQLSGLFGHNEVSLHTMYSTSDHATFLLCVIGLFWIVLFLGQSDCMVFVATRNYTFLHRITLFCKELQNNCTTLSKSESSNFFMCIWLASVTHVLLENFQVWVRIRVKISVLFGLFLPENHNFSVWFSVWVLWPKANLSTMMKIWRN